MRKVDRDNSRKRAKWRRRKKGQRKPEVKHARTAGAEFLSRILVRPSGWLDPYWSAK